MITELSGRAASFGKLTLVPLYLLCTARRQDVQPDGSDRGVRADGSAGRGDGAGLARDQVGQAGMHGGREKGIIITYYFAIMSNVFFFRDLKLPDTLEEGNKTKSEEPNTLKQSGKEEGEDEEEEEKLKMTV